MSYEHGTEAGYKRHYRNRVPYCGPCQRAHAEYNRQLLTRKRPDPDHGTATGLQYHLETRKPVCAMCLTYACNLEHDEAQRYLTAFRRAAA